VYDLLGVNVAGDKSDPPSAADAAKRLIQEMHGAPGATLAIVRMDSHSLFSEWKRLLEAMLRASRKQAAS
jgi:hypothetical protein